jgi:hypothetical protein
MPEQAFGYDCLGQKQTGLKMAERQLTMTNVLDDRHSAQRLKMLQICVRLSARIVGE